MRASSAVFVIWRTTTCVWAATVEVASVSIAGRISCGIKITAPTTSAITTTAARMYIPVRDGAGVSMGDEEIVGPGVVFAPDASLEGAFVDLGRLAVSAIVGASKSGEFFAGCGGLLLVGLESPVAGEVGRSSAAAYAACNTYTNSL